MSDSTTKTDSPLSTLSPVQEQNKGNQPEVSSSDQLELVSNKTEEKLVVQSEIVEKQEKEVVLMSEKAAPSFTSDQINAATSNVFEGDCISKS